MAAIEYTEVNFLLDPSNKIKNNNFRQSSSSNLGKLTLYINIVAMHCHKSFLVFL